MMLISSLSKQPQTDSPHPSVSVDESRSLVNQEPGYTASPAAEKDDAKHPRTTRPKQPSMGNSSGAATGPSSLAEAA